MGDSLFSIRQSEKSPDSDTATARPPFARSRKRRSASALSLGILSAAFSGGLIPPLLPQLSAQTIVNGTTNVARGRPYTLTPRPNYALTTDVGDDVQLTDGVYTSNNPMWTRATTVGWSDAAPVTIVIDLQTVQPIAGVSYSTAAGTADVQWPRSIFVLMSDDGQEYFPAGDLVLIPPGAPAPPAAGYAAAFRFATGDLHTHGRYVAIVVDPIGPYTFCDEIEVLAGDPAWLASPLTGDSTTDLGKFFVGAHMRVSVQRRLSADLDEARAALAASTIDAALRLQVTSELDAEAAEIATIPTPEVNGFTTVLPLNDLHARILAERGVIAQAEGFPALSAWVVNPWDFVGPVDRPPASSGPGGVSIAAMNGETRAGAVNLSNSTGLPMHLSLRITGTGGDALADLRPYEVLWTDTRELLPVADALVPLQAEALSIDLPAGMTRQIWLSFAPQDRAPGLYGGSLEATSADGSSISTPFELNVLAGTFPERPTLHLGGWDYTDRNNYYGLTTNNAAAVVGQLHALNVDSPWATSSVMPAGSFDVLGQLIQPPGTATFDSWVGSWPDANRYFVFISATSGLGNVTTTETSRFATAAGQWITFWVTHAAQLGIPPSRLMLLLVDEPHSASQDDLIVTWAKAIKAAQPDVGIWEDPTYPDPLVATPQLLDVSDVVALPRSLMLQQGAPFVGFYQRWATNGRTLNVYGSSGPARLIDPYTYDRLQAWICADIGATSSLFWSFTDDAGGHSWNEYAALQPPYSPFFLSDADVTISKHSEAIREGVEDFEYVTMLRQQVAALGQSDPTHAGLSNAQALLERATTSVLQSPGATDLQWASVKDRSVAESVRLMIADALAATSAEPPPPTMTVTGGSFTYDSVSGGSGAP